MDELLALFAKLNIAPEKLKDLAQSAQNNPFAAMGMIGELGLSPEDLQKIMQAVMANPEALLQLAKHYGADDEAMKNVEGSLSMLKGLNKS